MSYNAEYTLKLKQISDYDGLFTFPFDFYTDSQSIKSDFEKRFIEKYYFREIGFETVGMFRNRVQQRLNELAPKYKELYKIEIERAKLNYLFNKDLKETTTTTREIEGKLKALTDMNDETTSTGDNTNTSKESSLNNGNATIDKDTALTTVSETKDDVNTQNTTKSNSYTDTTNTNNELEDIVFLSQGNIGVTTSADLVDSWRKNVVDLNMQLIEEFNDLFMLIY